LVLDEPTSGLDGKNLELMAREIKKAAASGPAVLVITHDVELINLTADYLLSLEAPGDNLREGAEKPGTP
jgi:energy-coupling factor transport system ATP-binding protein